jgi:hypothetical protein
MSEKLYWPTNELYFTSDEVTEVMLEGEIDYDTIGNYDIKFPVADEEGEPIPDEDYWEWAMNQK